LKSGKPQSFQLGLSRINKAAMKHLRFTFAPTNDESQPETKVCLAGTINDSSLCGLNEGVCEVSGILDCETTVDKIDCEQCIQIIKYCKRVYAGEIKK